MVVHLNHKLISNVEFSAMNYMLCSISDSNKKREKSSFANINCKQVNQTNNSSNLYHLNDAPILSWYQPMLLHQVLGWVVWDTFLFPRNFLNKSVIVFLNWIKLSRSTLRWWIFFHLRSIYCGHCNWSRIPTMRFFIYESFKRYTLYKSARSVNKYHIVSAADFLFPWA